MKEGYFLRRQVPVADHSCGFGKRMRYYAMALYWDGHSWVEGESRRLTLWGTEAEARRVFGEHRADIEVVVDFDAMSPVPVPETSGVVLAGAVMTDDDLSDERKLTMADEVPRRFPAHARRW